MEKLDPKVPEWAEPAKEFLKEGYPGNVRERAGLVLFYAAMGLKRERAVHPLLYSMEPLTCEDFTDASEIGV